MIENVNCVEIGIYISDIYFLGNLIVFVFLFVLIDYFFNELNVKELYLEVRWENIVVICYN